MLNEHFYCIIMAGGIGSRFWPISRSSRPKQFLDFTSEDRSFLRMTYDRMKAVIPEDNIIVVSLTRYKELVLQQLPELPKKNLLLEPYNRNTAPCLTFATYYILKLDPLAVVAVAPSDHMITEIGTFNKTLSNALAYAASSDVLISIGVLPTRPDSNFGYIQMAGPIEDDKPVKVKTFTEKPDVELARIFIESGEFLWNSGIYVWRASEIRNEIECYAPEISSLWRGWQDMLGTEKQTAFIERIYTDIPRISIDYAVMEKSENVWVYPAKFKWADIGNWDSLYDYLSVHDDSGNASNIVGKELLRESSRNVIYSANPGKLVALYGMKNCLVVDTDDVLLICPRDSEKLRDFLSELAMPEYEEYR